MPAHQEALAAPQWHAKRQNTMIQLLKYAKIAQLSLLIALCALLLNALYAKIDLR